MSIEQYSTLSSLSHSGFEQPVHALKIQNRDGKEVVSVSYNGEVTFGEGVTPTDAAMEFWDALGSFSCTLSTENKQLKQENADLRAKLKRLTGE